MAYNDYEIIQKISRSIDLKAVDEPGDSIGGVIRIGSKEKVTRVKGICGKIEVSPNMDTVFFDAENLFFYGNIKDLMKNYRGKAYERLDLASFKDKEYAQNSETIDKIKTGFGFMQIPLEEMRLSFQQMNLIESLIEKTYDSLPAIINRLEKVQIIDETNFMKGFGNMFSGFPSYLKKQALENGSFYRFNDQKSGSFIENVSLPTIRIIYTPMGKK